jgi:hypothetical protein
LDDAKPAPPLLGEEPELKLRWVCPAEDRSPLGLDREPGTTDDARDPVEAEWRLEDEENARLSKRSAHKVLVQLSATTGRPNEIEVGRWSKTTPQSASRWSHAVGIDYSLFIINRHRRQLRDRNAVAETIALANGTSGNAVLFAGSTVIIALVALNLTGISFLGLMGTVGAASVAIVVLIAITLTPALLSLVGARPPRQREGEPGGPGRARAGRRGACGSRAAGDRPRARRHRRPRGEGGPGRLAAPRPSARFRRQSGHDAAQAVRPDR